MRRSNLFLTDLSLTPVTYLCKLLGILSVAASMQLEIHWVSINQIIKSFDTAKCSNAAFGWCRDRSWSSDRAVRY
ncbi:hypothetical protein CXH12_04660 [Citrobacter portucalensis]|nr:hypothetical protein CXH12_04660 [Citrobacter portucalensis]